MIGCLLKVGCSGTNKCGSAQTFVSLQFTVRTPIMKNTKTNFLMTFAIAVSFALIPLTGFAQNSNSSTGQMKESGSEVKKAGTSAGRNLKHGRIVRGGKHFGMHMGRAGKHFGKGTKKAGKRVGRGTKRVVKKVIS